MAILALPKATSQSLGSLQVLPCPAALVKELLDNAIDAKATSIDIAISANTLDKIEVRDNGHGIASGDLDALGRRGYTSKLRNLEELRKIGGLTLGFRGEALASAAELGQVSIVTRTDGETIATAVKLQANGGLESRNLVSHPVGTTVCIVNLFLKYPVRKEKALKDRKKTLSQIKNILQSYALARFNIRLSLRVLKAEQSNWSFAPRPKDNIKDIVAQVISRSIAAQCVEKFSGSLPSTHSWSHDSKGMYSSNQQHQTAFLFQAFLPKPEAEISKLPGRQYVSVDSRPVSCARGTLRKLITSYKNHINSAATDANQQKIKDPFLYLNIICPPASYDPNIEPAKDNVLFDDETLLLSMADEWFESIYGTRRYSIDFQCKQRKPEDQQSYSPLVTEILNLRDGYEDIYESLNANDNSDSQDIPQKEALENLINVETTLYANSITPESAPRYFSFKGKHILQARNTINPQLDMSEDFMEIVDIKEGKVTRPCIESSTLGDMERTPVALKNLNPWVIAKINAPLVEHLPQAIESPNTKGLPNNKSLPAKPLKYPSVSSPKISPLVPKSHQAPWIFQKSPQEAIGATSLQRSLNGWLDADPDVGRCAKQACISTISPLSRNVNQNGTSKSTCNNVTNKGTVRSFPYTPPSTRERLPSQQPASSYRSFVSPLRSSKSKVLEGSPKSVGALKSLPSRHPQHNKNFIDVTPSVEEQNGMQETSLSMDIAEALEFERRKETATLKLRAELRQSQANSVGTLQPSNLTTRIMPYKDHRQANLVLVDASEKLSTSNMSMDTMLIRTSLSDGDPRAYLMRRQHSISFHADKLDAKPKLKRARTVLLPLETTPDHMKLHCSIQLIHVDAAQVRKYAVALTDFDEYATSGKFFHGLEYTPANLAAIENRINDIVKKWV